MTIRISLAVVLALVFAAIGAGVAVGVMAWEPWDGDEKPEAETAYMRRLTGAEAAALVFDRENIRRGPDLPRGVIYFDCKADDFNERLRAWIVVCKFGSRAAVELAADATFRIYDETEEIEGLLME